MIYIYIYVYVYIYIYVYMCGFVWCIADVEQWNYSAIILIDYQVYEMNIKERKNE